MQYHTRVAHPNEYEAVKRLTLADFPEAKMVATQNALSGQPIVRASFPANKNAVHEPRQPPKRAHNKQTAHQQPGAAPVAGTSGHERQTATVPMASHAGHQEQPSYVVDNDDALSTVSSSTYNAPIAQTRLDQVRCRCVVPILRAYVLLVR